MIRDVRKILTTRQYYTKQNKHILRNPYLYVKALYDGFQTEKVSRLMEQILLARCKKYQSLFEENVDKYDLSTISDVYKFR